MDKIDALDEIGLYFFINATGGFIWRMSHGNIPETSIEGVTLK